MPRTFDSWELPNCKDDCVLIHYGIPGMKWGIRKKLSESDRFLIEGAKKEVKNLKRGYKASMKTYKKNKRAGLVSKEDDVYIRSHFKEDRRRYKQDVKEEKARAKRIRSDIYSKYRK